MKTPTTDSISLGGVQRELERQLEERLAVLQELQPFALPSVDPVAYQTSASHRVAIDQITAALNRIAAGTYGLCTRCGRADRARAARGPSVRGRLHRMSEPC